MIIYAIKEHGYINNINNDGRCALKTGKEQAKHRLVEKENGKCV